MNRPEFVAFFDGCLWTLPALEREVMRAQGERAKKLVEFTLRDCLWRALEKRHGTELVASDSDGQEFSESP